VSKILLMLMLFVMPVSAEMRKVEIPVKAICWDSLDEAIEHHKETLGEYPIVKLYSGDQNGGALLVKPDYTRWTFIAFKTHQVTKQTIACAFFVGTAWRITLPPVKDADNDKRIPI